MAKQKVTVKKKPKKADDRPKGTIKKMRLDTLSFPADLQMRDGLEGKDVYEYHVDDIAEGIKKAKKGEGKEPPPPRVWAVPGKGNVVTDGRHTTRAYAKLGYKEIPVEFFEGDWIDAVKDAAGANIHEGAALKRTLEDKRRAVTKLILALQEAGEDWTDNRIAKHTGSSGDTVKRVRLHLPKPAKPLPRVGADNKKYDPEKTEAAGKRAAEARREKVSAQPKIPRPEAKPEPPKAPSYDWKRFEEKYGPLSREIDAIAEAFGAQNSPGNAHCRQMLRELYHMVAEWHTKLTEKAKAAAPKSA